MKKMHYVKIALDSAIIGCMFSSALVNAFTVNDERLYVYISLVILGSVRCIICEQAIRRLEDSNDWLRHQILHLVGLPPKDEDSAGE